MQSLSVLLLLLIPLIVVIAQQQERQIAQQLNQRYAQLVMAQDKKGLSALFHVDFKYHVGPNVFSRGKFLSHLWQLKRPIQFTHNLSDAKFKSNGILEMRTYYKINAEYISVNFMALKIGRDYKFIAGYQLA